MTTELIHSTRNRIEDQLAIPQSQIQSAPLQAYKAPRSGTVLNVPVSDVTMEGPSAISQVQPQAFKRPQVDIRLAELARSEDGTNNTTSSSDSRLRLNPHAPIFQPPPSECSSREARAVTPTDSNIPAAPTEVLMTPRHTFVTPAIPAPLPHTIIPPVYSHQGLEAPRLDPRTAEFMPSVPSFGSPASVPRQPANQSGWEELFVDAQASSLRREHGRYITPYGNEV